MVWRRTTLQKGTPCDSPPMLKPLSKPVPRFCVLVKAVPHENVPKNPPASEIAGIYLQNVVTIGKTLSHRLCMDMDALDEIETVRLL